MYALTEAIARRWQGVMLGWTLAIWASDLRRMGGFAAAVRNLTEEVTLGSEAVRLPAPTSQHESTLSDSVA